MIFFCVSEKQNELQNNGIVEYNSEFSFIMENQKPNYSEYQNVITDTLTNWQFYLDDQLILKSHTGNPDNKIAKINATTEYEFFKFQIFYDFHHGVDKRKIEMIVDNEPIKIYTETRETLFPFKIKKDDFELVVEEYFNREIVIKFYDPINPNGLKVGIIKIINE